MLRIVEVWSFGWPISKNDPKKKENPCYVSKQNAREGYNVVKVDQHIRGYASGASSSEAWLPS